MSSSEIGDAQAGIPRPSSPAAESPSAQRRSEASSAMSATSAP